MRLVGADTPARESTDTVGIAQSVGVSISAMIDSHQGVLSDAVSRAVGSAHGRVSSFFSSSMLKSAENSGSTEGSERVVASVDIAHS